MVVFTTTTHHDTYPGIQKTRHKGHVVLITGASRGIGLAIACSFAQAGASAIAISARSSLDAAESSIRSAAKSAGGHETVPTILKLALDVSDETSVTEAVAKVDRQFGRVDILINNAGFVEPWVPLGQSKPADWWQTWEINFKGVYLVSRSFLPLVLKSESCKTIVNVSSSGALVVIPRASSYLTSKFALLRFTEFLAAEYAEQGIVTFAVHPGGVWTEMTRRATKNVPLTLNETPALAGDTLSWLTQEPRPWLNGRYVSVVWDMQELLARKDEILQEDKLKMRLFL